MVIKVRAFCNDWAEEWDALVKSATAGTFLQSRRFLSYHADRYVDASLGFYEGDRLVGVLAAAHDPHVPSTVTSHPGITYGGVLHAGGLRGEVMLEAMKAALHHYAGVGFSRLRYKAVPYIYHRAPSQDDLYALFRLNARRYRCDLAAVVDVAGRLPVSSRRRRAHKKGVAARITLSEDPDLATALWLVVTENLARKHAVAPVHTQQEIELLRSYFPEGIRFVSAREEQAVVAGVVLFETPMVLHAQYIASSQRGNDIGALDVVFEHCIQNAAQSGKRFFSFGTCNEGGGWVLNSGLYRFKSEFGAAGVVHDFFELDLTANLTDTAT